MAEILPDVETGPVEIKFTIVFAEPGYVFQNTLGHFIFENEERNIDIQFEDEN